MKEVVHTPYVLDCSGTYINGIRVWDKRWYVNIFCKINWFLHFKQRKVHKKYANTKVNAKFYHEIR